MALNSQEIVILGGLTKEEGLNEILIFDTKTEECRKVGDTGDLKFDVAGNQAAQVSSGRVLILTSKNEMIEWTKGKDGVKILGQF